MTNDFYDSYQWDAEGRVASVDGGETEIATYNALGQQARLNEPDNGYSWDQLYDLSGHWLGMYALNAWNLGGNFWLGDRNFGWYSDYLNETYFEHRNLLQSTQVTTDQTGNPANDVLFYPWGINILGGTSSGFSDFAYEDNTDWLLHTQYRQYNTGSGRWMSPDPAGLGAADVSNPQSLNLYSYALNNPTTLTDPLGLATEIPTNCSACPSGPQLEMIMNLVGCSTLVSIFDECLVIAVAMGPGGPGGGSPGGGAASNKSQAAKAPPSCVGLFIQASGQVLVDPSLSASTVASFAQPVLQGAASYAFGQAIAVRSSPWWEFGSTLRAGRVARAISSARWAENAAAIERYAGGAALLSVVFAELHGLDVEWQAASTGACK